MADKELQTAKEDLNRAEKTYNEKDYKWATVQLYYSMFHSARALLYFENLREHSHYCLITAIRELYVNTGKLPSSMVEGLQEAKNLREDADYYGRWTQAGVKNC
ncbi:MAG: HEPN domain-containing protein [Elusimicrobia bacterium]|nr:HEPN domain-containing protein [Elusimicrobiota bacterium]